MRKTDVPLRLWQRYPYRHNLSFLSLCISSLCLCESDYLCTDPTSLILICSASHTHSLCLSASQLSSPPLCFAYKPMANLFVLSLIAIKSSDKHRCFTQRAEHNNTAKLFKVVIMTLVIKGFWVTLNVNNSQHNKTLSSCWVSVLFIVMLNIIMLPSRPNLLQYSPNL